MNQPSDIETQSHLFEYSIKNAVAKETTERLFSVFGIILQIKLVKSENFFKEET